LTLQQFKVIHGHRFWCQWKAHYYVTSYYSLIVTLAVSATVFEIFMLKDRQESCAIAKMTARCALYTVFRKKTPTHSFFHISMSDMSICCSEYTQGTADSNNVEIRYSLRPMT